MKDRDCRPWRVYFFRVHVWIIGIASRTTCSMIGFNCTDDIVNGHIRGIHGIPGIPFFDVLLLRLAPHCGRLTLKGLIQWSCSFRIFMFFSNCFYAVLQRHFYLVGGHRSAAHSWAPRGKSALFCALLLPRSGGLVGLTHTRHLLGPCRALHATHSAFIEANARHFRPDGVVSFSVVI